MYIQINVDFFCNVFFFLLIIIKVKILFLIRMKLGVDSWVRMEMVERCIFGWVCCHVCVNRGES